LRDQQQLWVQEDRPLTNTLWRLDGQADTVWRSKNYLLSELNWLELQLESEQDPIVIQQLMLRIDRLNSQLFWTDGNLSSLQNQSWNVQRTRVDRYWQHQQNQRLVNQQLNDSQKSLESVDRNEHRLDTTMSRERRKAEAKSRRVRAAEAKTASLKAYLTFPMEFEKIRLLNSF
jgi:chromosome segregation ATPase